MRIPAFRLTPCQLACAAVVVALTASTNSAFAQDNAFCLECHGRDRNLVGTRGDRQVSLFVDLEQFNKSVHADLDCVTCHEDLEDTELPHKFDLARVDCTMCHDEAAEEFAESIHGQRLEEEDPLAPRCQDCHGNHYIVPLSDPKSAVAPFNVPQMCAQCHAEGAPVERAYDIPQDQILKRYTQSIHGEGLFKQGLVVTAVCTSCHTGHHVLPHDDPKSSISKENVTATCMKCHGIIENVHRKIIRGSMWEKEPNKIPNCVECHSPHEARKASYDTGLANADCLHCHRDPELVATADGKSLFVNPEEYAESIHGRKVVACAQCHTGVDPSDPTRPCASLEQKVDCAICHEAAVSDYEMSVHGTLHAKGDPNAPACADCHGTHGILEHSIKDDAPTILQAKVRESPTFAINVPTLCGKCHREGGKAAVRYLGEQHNIVQNYTMSIHGKGLLESGLTVTATCTSCHTAHRALPASDPAASVNPDHIAATCGECHHGIYDKYSTSVHSPTGNPEYTQLQGMSALPRCNDCHSPHSISRTDENDFKLSIMDQCGKCHQELTESYFNDTYHGKVSLLGEAETAKCQDCHGAHDILRVTDPKSRLSHDNIVATCAQCHPGAHRQFAGYLTHATHHDPKKYPALYYAFWGMTTLLVGTFGFFGLHTLIWLPRSWRMRKELRQAEAALTITTTKQYMRFVPKVRIMHLVMILSFFGLAITGMMLKFSYTRWAVALSRALGGFESAGFIHRTCAVAMFTLFVFHLWDLRKRYIESGKTLWSFIFGPESIVPRFSDIGEFFATMKWFIGRGPKPDYGRWTYWEKFDYFAVFWGIAIIGSTGVFLWFPEVFTYVLPGWLINVATIIHSDEALLATGFIFTIHFFNANLRPEKFPMDTVIFTGRMPLAELKHERPLEYQQMVESGQLDKRMVDPPSPLALRVIKIFGATALLIGLTLVVLIVYAMIEAYR
ncbi:MAG: cytochrome c3 family protein [Phycisphaerales bacterium]|nr:cytochrome c3 family protein [Phycisphaerales bacterium]